jgi:hypothetical protein
MPFARSEAARCTARRAPRALVAVSREGRRRRHKHSQPSLVPEDTSHAAVCLCLTASEAEASHLAGGAAVVVASVPSLGHFVIVRVQASLHVRRGRGRGVERCKVMSRQCGLARLGAVAERGASSQRLAVDRVQKARGQARQRGSEAARQRGSEAARQGRCEVLSRGRVQTATESANCVQIPSPQSGADFHSHSRNN